MILYVIRRLIGAIVLFFCLTITTFIIFFVLPVTQTTYYGSRQHQRLEQAVIALNGSVPHQYVQFLGDILHGSLGQSVVRHQDVNTVIASAAPVTISLVIGGMIFALIIALPVGILSALRSRSLLDRAATISVLVGISVHPIWIGLVLSYLLGFRLHVLPIAGYCDLRGDQVGCGGPVQWAYHLVLPWFAFAILFAALYMRMVRASVLEALDQDYVRTARAKGAPEHHVIRAHVLRNALLPLVTMVGMDIGLAFGGAVFVEAVFGLPGLGQVALSSLRQHDLATITGLVVWVTLTIVVINLVVDLLYACVDPRIRLGSLDPPERLATSRA